MTQDSISSSRGGIGKSLRQSLVALAGGRHRILREVIQRDPAARGEFLPHLQRLGALARGSLQARQHAQGLRIVRLQPNRGIQAHLRFSHFVLLQIIRGHLCEMPALATLQFSVGPVARVSRTAQDGEDEKG
jgi:hypothetical protein